MESLTFLMVSTYYPPYHLGGDAVFVRHLSEELVHRGHKVHIFHNPNAYDVIRRGTPAPIPMETGVTRHAYLTRTPLWDIGLTLSVGTSGKADRQLSEIIREINPDIVHWHNAKGFLPQTRDNNGHTNLYTAHDYHLVCPRSNLLRSDFTVCGEARWCQLCLLRWQKPPQLWRIGRRRPIRPPEGVGIISPSEFVSRRLAADGIRTDILLRNFVPDLGKRVLRSTDDLDAITYLGLMEHHKGVIDLLQSFSSSRRDHEFRLTFVGDGGMRKAVLREKDKLGLGDRVEVAGFLSQDRLTEVLNRTAVQAVPSLWHENAPLVVLEAMSRGIPILGSDRGGLPEILGGDTGATVFEGGNKGDLAAKIIQLWQGRHDLARRGERSRLTYERNYTPETHIRKYVDFARTWSVR